jgi:hypothetical protein
MSSEIMQSVTYDNYDDFQIVNFVFSQKNCSLFWELFNDGPDLLVKLYIYIYIYIYIYPTQMDKGSYCYSLRESMLT